MASTTSNGSPRGIPEALTWTLVLLLPAIVLVLLRGSPNLDPVVAAPIPHFFVVSLTSFLALVLAALVAVAAQQLRDARVFMFGLAFALIAAIFLTHALTTPGALVGSNPWVGRSARLSLLIGALLLALSAVDLPATLRRWIVRCQGRLLAVAMGGCVVYLVFCLAASPGVADETAISGSGDGTAISGSSGHAAERDDYGAYGGYEEHHEEYGGYGGYGGSSRAAYGLGHGSLDAADEDPEWLSWTVMGVALLLLGVAGVRHWLHYRRSRLVLQRHVVLSIMLLAHAQVSMALTPTWHLSWWTYHAYMLLAFVALLTGLVQAYSRGRSLSGVLEGLFLRDAIEQIQRGYNDVINALVEAVEAKDPYTSGHTRRVALLAALIVEEMGLPAEEANVVVQAAVLHDIGKIGVPDTILNKPGPLTAEEFAVVKEHPVRGHQIIDKVRSLRREAGGVRHHHERMDGSGYPDGLRGTEIPLAARVIAVADVFDALTSPRAYRGPWPVDAALRYLQNEAGRKFDPECVEALHRALARHGQVWERAIAEREHARVSARANSA